MSSCVFDSPQWQLKVPAAHVQDSRVLTSVAVTQESRLCQRVDIVTPLELFSFAEQVMKVPASELSFYLEQVGLRFYFGVCGPQHDQDLWFYHKSNLPAWAKPLFSASAAKREKANE